VTENVFSIYSLGGIIFVDFLKPPSVENFKNAIDDVVLCERNRRRLWDLTCGIKFTTAEIKALARYAKSELTTPFSKAAIVAPDNLTFGLFRVHDVEREDSLVEQIVFRNKRDALAWLKQCTVK
jgi:hypothetical protein